MCTRLKIKQEINYNLPEPLPRLKSFQDVEDQGYKVVSRGAGRLAHTNLKNAPEGSAMQRLYGSDWQGFKFLADKK